MNDLKEYLENKIKNRWATVNEGMSAALVLGNNIENSDNTLDKFIEISIQKILVATVRGDIAGIAKLTKVSSSIGKSILKIIDNNNLGRDRTFVENIKMGDMFIEALFQCDYISVYRDASFSENDRTAPYVIQIEDKWSEIADMPLIKEKEQLRGTFFEKPLPVTKSCIKRTQMSNENWNSIKDSQHINAVNKLQSVPYRVNLEVLNTIKENSELFISKDKIKIPKSGNKSKMDKAYALMRRESNRCKGKASDELERLKVKYEKEALLWNKKLIALKARSKKTAHEYVIQKAELLHSEPKFYQTIELDYRGRFYYNESFFNFQGTDVARGLMEFADGVKMTPEGERALAIHTAASYNESFAIDEIPDYFEEDYKSYLEAEGLDSISVDKMSLNDREWWTRMNLERIVIYAKNRELRMEAEKPVCFLSCCVEWKNLLSDPDHLTRLPIQIDGSNNGWQHLAAMSKDKFTGDMVGLIPRKIPKDFYVQTAKKLVEMDQEWFKEKNMPMKHIRKGISKRGSMTRAYSAGERTMGINMYADCHQEGFTNLYGITVEDCNNLSHKLIQAINEVCPGPLSTMRYLQKLAQYELGTYKWFDDHNKIADKKYRKLKKERNTLLYKKDKDDLELKRLSDLTVELSGYTSKLVNGNGKSYISWRTPSGFLVEYKCFTTQQLEARSTIKGIGVIKHKGVEETIYPDSRGYASGISPNFVHSLDGSHMSIVIDNWDRDFAAVHDAFAVHAPYVDDLLYITKESFIMMYDYDNFYDWIEETLLSNTDGLDVEQPIIGELDIEGVRKSDNFFA